MFEVGWSELLVIAIVMIVIVGPKDLPKMLRTFGKLATKARSMAGDFQRQFNDALKEAELDDVKNAVDSIRDLNPKTAIKKHLNPFESAANEVRDGLKKMESPSPKAAPDAPHPAEPLKAGPLSETTAAVEQVAEVSAKPATKATPAAKAAPAKASGAKLAPTKTVASKPAKAPAKATPATKAAPTNVSAAKVAPAKATASKPAKAAPAKAAPKSTKAK